MNLHHPFDSALAQALLHSLWQGALLALLAALALGSLARRSAALRHAIGMLFLAAMVLLPLATFAFLALGPTMRTVSVSAGPSSLTEAAVVISRPIPMPAPLWLPWAWFGGVAIMLVRLLGGWWMVRNLDHQAFQGLPQDWARRVAGLSRAMGLRREVSVRLLEGLGLPCSTRAWRPVIWLPLTMLSQLSPDQIEAVLAHELAHIRRLDWIWNGLQCLVEALMFYHPGVWWLSRRIRQERELACDDLAVALCGDAIALAEALATLEGLRTQHRARPQGTAHRLAPSLALGANGGSLMNRIQHLLSPPPPPRFRWSLPAGALVILGSGALLIAQANRPAVSQPVKAEGTPASPNLAPGSSRLISDDSDGVRRVYRKGVSLFGKVTETYTEDGRTKPIDADIRQWIDHQARGAAEAGAKAETEARKAEREARKAEVEMRNAESEARRAEAALKGVDAPPPPPAPPAPPEPPTLKESAPCRQALAQAQGDTRLQALLGSPIAVGSEIKGSMTSWGPGDVQAFFGLLPTGSKAELQIPVSGPKGSATLHASGKLVRDTWTFSRLEAVSAQGHRLNLLTSK